MKEQSKGADGVMASAPPRPTDAMIRAGAMAILRSNGCHRADAEPDESDHSQAAAVYVAMVAAGVAAGDGGQQK